MPITTIDSVPALVVIDLQKGIAAFPMARPLHEVAGSTVLVARAFRERGLPVVLVNVAGMAPGRTDTPRPSFTFPPDWTDILPELEQSPDDYVVTKHRIGAILGTDLHEYLQRRGVTQVVMTGVATGWGVESTARGAYDLGYNVVFVTDAMTDRSTEAHQYCVENIFPRLGETTTTEDFLRLLSTERP